MASSAMGSFLGGLGGGAIGSAVVKLFLDNGQYQAELAKSQAQLGTSTTTMGQRLNAFKVAGAAAFAAVGFAAIRFAGQSVQAASDQAEAANKVKVVFTDAAGTVESFANSAAISLGISKTAALSAAGVFGNLFTNVGFTTQAAADMSVELVQLAGDLASFNNIDPTLALEKLRAGLSGEAEPLRAVGVFLSEAKVQAEAFESGIAKVGDTLTDQQKIQARYNLILKETTLAQGDFERTSDGLANQQRKLRAQIEDFAASAGRVLLPALTAVVAALSWMLNNLPTVIELVIAFGAAWAAVNAGAIAGKLNGIVNTVALLGSTIVEVLPQLALLAGAWSPVILGAAVATGQLEKILTLLSDDISASEAGVKVSERLNALLGEMSPKMQALAKSSPEVSNALSGVAESLKVVWAAGWDVNDAVDYTNEAIAKTGSTLKFTVKDYEAWRDEGILTAHAQEVLASAARHSRVATETQAEATKRVTEELKEARQAAKEAAKAYRDDLVTSFNQSGQAVFGFKARIQGTTQAFVRGLQAMRTRLKTLNEDMDKFNRLPIGDKIRDFLLQQGPEAIHAFVTANKESRDDQIGYIRDIVAKQGTLDGAVKESANKVTNLKEKINNLNTTTANPKVIVKYDWDRSGLDPATLPGIA